MKWNGIEVTVGEFVVEAREFFGQQFIVHGIGRREWEHRLHAADHQKDILVSCRFFVLEVWGQSGTKIVAARRVIQGALEEMPVRTPHFVRGACGWGWCRLSDLVEFVGVQKVGLLTMNRSVLRVIVGEKPEGELVLLPPDFDLDAKELPVGRTLIDPTQVWVPAGWAKQVCILAAFESK